MQKSRASPIAFFVRRYLPWFVSLVVTVVVITVGAYWRGVSNARVRMPVRREEVVAKLPSAGDTLLLRKRLSMQPRELGSAVSLARLYLSSARAQSDPRYLGLAEGVLAPWWEAALPPVPIALLRGTIRQSRHEFQVALGDLALATHQSPNDPQSWLTQATVLTVVARYDEALDSCAHLAALINSVVSVSCGTNVRSITGQAVPAYTELLLSLKHAQGADERAWGLTTLGEIAARQGDLKRALGHFREAEMLQPDDVYNLGAEADALLDLGRRADVIALLRDRSQHDGLLLRLVLAYEDQAEGEPLIASIKARFADSRLRGDAIHMREESRFALAIERDSVRALSLAQRNFLSQQEPWDVRVLLQAALATKDKNAARPALEWLERTHHEDPILRKLKDQIGATR